MSRPIIFHLLPNAHLDPVWLWDWREGLNQGINTCRTVLDLMDEVPELTFIRGESAVYQHIERHDPETFERIRAMAAAGRWDVVGGTVIQPDTNLPATETFCRHFLHGKRYFAERFGKDVKVGWSADSFGHAAGLPEVLSAAGIESYAFSRPAPDVLPLAKPAFWWRTTREAARVMGYRIPAGWYGADRAEMPRRLDALLAVAQKNDLENHGVFFGLGDHGGGPTRRQLADVRAWAEKHPEVTVKFSGLHALFAALRAEVARHGDDFLPTHVGEMNFVLRGCYSSVAKFKFAYRRAEAHLGRAEAMDTAIAAATGSAPGDLHDAWHGLLFNAFHDILPGSSIERAYDDQIAWLGGVRHAAHETEVTALNRLARQVDTSVPEVSGDDPRAVPLIVWNPHARAFKGYVELEASLDDRPLAKYSTAAGVGNVPVRVTGPNGRAVPFQLVQTEHTAMPTAAWRKRAVVPVELPPLGWAVYTMGYVEGAKPPKVESKVAATKDGISNGTFAVRAKVGARGIAVTRGGKPFLGKGGLHFQLLDDPWGSWGAMDEAKESLCVSAERSPWYVTEVRVLERGPLRAAVWVEMKAADSRLELVVSLGKGRDAVDVAGRLHLDERSARVKVVLPPVAKVKDPVATFDVPGAAVTRGPAGEVPGGRWARAGHVSFASDALYNFDLTDGGALRATVARASRYADDVPTESGDRPWLPAVDSGELRFNFLIAPDGADVAAMAEELERPPVAVLTAAHGGARPRSGSLGAVAPAAAVKVLAIKPAEVGPGVVLRVQNTGRRAVVPTFSWMAEDVRLTEVPAGAIRTWVVNRGDVRVVDAAETAGRGG